MPVFIIARLRARLRDAARRSALGAAGVFLVVLGAGFLLAAIWIILAEWLDALLASALMGAVLAGVGLILLGLAARSEPVPEPLPDDRSRDAAEDAMLRRLLREAGLEVPPKGQKPPIVDAFLFGLVMALRLRQQREAQGKTGTSAKD